MGSGGSSDLFDKMKTGKGQSDVSVKVNESIKWLESFFKLQKDCSP